jgi:hypothetical protein
VGLSFTWTLRRHGWAFATIADEHGHADATASYITDAPESLLRAVASLARGEAVTQAQFDAEPTQFTWFFDRDDNQVEIRLVKAPDTDQEGVVIWSGRYPVRALAEAVLSGFDRTLSELGEDAYRERWVIRSFPHAEVEALRAAQHVGDE